MKRTRNGHQDNIEVQHYRSKFSRVGSGRPVKKKVGEVAGRDRQKQVNFFNEYLFVSVYLLDHIGFF